MDFKDKHIVYRKKTTIFLFISIATLLCAFLFWLFSKIGILKIFFPIEKRNFDEYIEFRKNTSTFFPDDMWDSAQNIKYYYYDGSLKEINVLSVELDNDDLNDALEQYDVFFVGDRKKLCKNDNNILTSEFLNSESIYFLNGFINAQVEEFRIHHYYKLSDSEFDTMYGVFVNKKNNQIIIFYFHEEKY